MEKYRVKMDHNSRIALELRRNEKVVTAILPDGTTRRVEKIRIADFDKQWKDLAYEPIRAAEKMLTQKFINLSASAQKELIMLVILNVQKTQVIGKFEDVATAVACSPDDSVCIAGPESLAQEMSEKEMIALYNSLVTEDKQITGRVKGGKALFSNELFEVLKNITLTPAELKTPKTGDGPVAKAHQIFAANAALPIEERKTRKEIILACVEAGINQATATTQFGKFHSEIQGGSKMERTGAVSKVREIIAENFGKKTRKEIIALCEEAGCNKATASTQYGKYNQEANSQVPAEERERIAAEKAAADTKVKADKEAAAAEKKEKAEADKAEKKAAKEAAAAEKKAAKEAADAAKATPAAE